MKLQILIAILLLTLTFVKDQVFAGSFVHQNPLTQWVLIPSFSNNLLLAQNEVSLKDDQKTIEELRENIPEDIKSENDQLGFILKLFDDKTRRSDSIQREFDKYISRLRKEHDTLAKQKRNQFTKNEKSSRNDFLAKSKDARLNFLKDKPVTDKRKEFFENERTERQAYFSTEKDQRKDFESNIKSEKSDFEDKIKRIRKDFDEKKKVFLREQKELEDLKKQSLIKPKTKTKASLSPENQQYLDDFNKIPKDPGEPLEPGN